MQLVYDASRIDGFEGSAILKMPKYRERLQMVKECNFKVGKDGEMESGFENLSGLTKMIDYASKAVEKMEIKHKESYHVAKSFDELELNPVFDAIISDLAGFYMNAGKVGNG